MKTVWFTVAAVASKGSFAWRNIMSSSASSGRASHSQIQALLKNRGGVFLTDGGTGEEMYVCKCDFWVDYIVELLSFLDSFYDILLA